MNKRRIWVKQFKTDKEVAIPISDKLLTVLIEAKEWGYQGCSMLKTTIKITLYKLIF